MDLAPPPDPTPAAPVTLADQVLKKLADAPAPLAFAGVKKGLKKPAKQSKDVFDANIREALVAATRAGRAFGYPSGKGGEERYWARDEKHAIREAALRLADAPDTLPKLVKAASGEWKSDAAFADGVIRDLIAEERLFEHPPAKKGKGALVRFGSRPAPLPPPPPPPPHPLTLKAAKAPFAAFLKAAQKLLALPGVELDDLFARARAELAPAQTETAPIPAPTHTPPAPPERPAADVDLAGLILTAVGETPAGQVLSLPELRGRMPASHRGAAFDQEVVRLAMNGQVALFRHNQPGGLSDEERAALVGDGHGNYFTGIAGRD